MLWTALLILILVIVMGLAFSIDGSWFERVLLASFLCGIVVYGFYRVIGPGGLLGP